MSRATKTLKGLSRKLFNILPPTVLFIAAGLIAAGMTLMDISIIQDMADIHLRMMFITQIATMWLVFVLGIATHLTLWTDIEEATAEGP